MTWDERVAKVRLHGFTDRQSAFLVTVMLHAGVCLGRHYCTFADLAYGRKMHDFFQALLARGYATARACGHHKARLYHIHYKPLYRAIGEPNNRHRRPTPLPRAIERLMLLDAVLADRERTWLATEQDKLAYFTLTHRVPRQDLPSLTFRAADAETVRVLSGEAADWARPRRPDPHLSLPADAGCADRFSRLSRAARRSASGAAGVDRAPARAVPQGRRHPDLSSGLSRAGRLTAASGRPGGSCAGTFTRVERLHEARTSASIRRCGPSARPGFRRCIGPGWKAASLCWTRRCHRR